jgi:hypothetical protein
MKGTERKVIFQGVHQLMGSDLGPAWGEGEPRISKMVFIGIDLPRDILEQGWSSAWHDPIPGDPVRPIQSPPLSAPPAGPAPRWLKRPRRSITGFRG